MTEENTKKRVTLKSHEFDRLKLDIDILTHALKEHKELQNSINTLNELISKFTDIRESDKKSFAAFKATEIRTQNAIKKIENSMNIFRMENKKISVNAISKNSGVSYNTVKKYLSKNTIISFNESIVI